MYNILNILLKLGCINVGDDEYNEVVYNEVVYNEVVSNEVVSNDFYYVPKEDVPTLETHIQK